MDETYINNCNIKKTNEKSGLVTCKKYTNIIKKINYKLGINKLINKQTYIHTHMMLF